MNSLQLILVAGILVMAAINAASLIWAFYLDQKLKRKPVPKVYDVHVEGTKVFPEMDMAKVEEQARQQLLQVIGESSKELQQSVAKTIKEVSARIDTTTTTALSQEFEKYQVSLQALREQSIKEFNTLQKEIDDHRAALLSQLDKDISAQQSKQLEVFKQQLDGRLNDVVSAYLLEALGSQVDLGAQSAYIFQALAAHKDDIKRDILS
jgi:F0F1-type ATP synthase membrane subunit b/b'